jgi:pyruvate formate lyase activating enzyme
MIVAPSADDLRIAGMVPLSTVDRPGSLVATVFCQGCPWRCTYCQNTAILDPTVPGQVPFSRVLDLLDRRRGLLDGVVFSGGEATMQHALVPAAAAVRDRGFSVGLHTGGAFPRRLAALLGQGPTGGPLVDWVGFDVKASPGGYDGLVGRPRAWDRAQESLRLLLRSGVDHELRMTVTPDLLDQVPVVLEMIAEQTRAAAGGGTGTTAGTPTGAQTGAGRSPGAGVVAVQTLVLQQAQARGTSPEFAARLAATRDWDGRFAAAVREARRVGVQVGTRVEVRGSATLVA